MFKSIIVDTDITDNKTKAFKLQIFPSMSWIILDF